MVLPGPLAPRPTVPKRHCWLRFRPHVWGWHVGLHKLFFYRHCIECGWPGGMVRNKPEWGNTENTHS